LGMVFANGQCVSCPEYCDNCSNSYACIQCSQGYFLSENECFSVNTTCEADSFGCEVCQDGNCVNCYPGYYLTDDSQCEQCPSDCITCDSTTNCLVCSEGYLLTNQQCLPCPNNCFECSTTETCLECWPGYGLTDEGSCFSCSDSNCAECDVTGNVCYVCAAFYYVEESTLGCKPCMDGCYQCNSGDTCAACTEGYILGADGICANTASLDDEENTAAQLLKLKPMRLKIKKSSHAKKSKSKKSEQISMHEGL